MKNFVYLPILMVLWGCAHTNNTPSNTTEKQLLKPGECSEVNTGGTICMPTKHERKEAINARNNESEVVKAERARRSQELVDAVNKEYSRLKDANTQTTKNQQSTSSISPLRSMNDDRKTPSIGYFKYETEPTGFNKICYYDVLGDIKAVNMNAALICPTTYDF